MRTLKSIAIAIAGVVAASVVMMQSNSATLADAPDGAAIYTAKCASCHKADGKGGGSFPALAGNKDTNAKDPTAVIAIMLHGKGLMPKYQGKLSNAEIAAVLTYIRSSWGNNAPAVAEADVAAGK